MPLLYETLEQLLGEFFVHMHATNVGFSLGDLFGASFMLLGASC